MKGFSTVRDPQRGSQRYMKKRRGAGDRGEQEEKKGASREERHIYAVLSSLRALHSPEDPQRLTELD